MPQTAAGERLWRVTLSVEMVVLATTEDSAIEIAERNAAEEVQHSELTVESAVTVRSLSSLPPGWRDCIPWGDDANEMTCEEIIAAMLPTEAEQETAGQLTLTDAPDGDL